MIGIAANTDRGAGAQAALIVFAGIGKGFCFAEIFYGNHAAQIKIIIHHQNFFDAMAVQQLFDRFGRRTFFDSNEPLFWRHDTSH